MVLRMWEVQKEGEKSSWFLDIISNYAPFANALSDEEPHQHFSGDQTIP